MVHQSNSTAAKEPMVLSLGKLFRILEQQKLKFKGKNDDSLSDRIVLKGGLSKSTFCHTKPSLYKSFQNGIFQTHFFYSKWKAERPFL